MPDNVSYCWSVTWANLLSLYNNVSGRKENQQSFLEGVFPVIFQDALNSRSAGSRVFTTNNGSGIFGKFLKIFATATNPAGELYSREEDHAIIQGFLRGWSTVLEKLSDDQLKALAKRLDTILLSCKNSIEDIGIKQRFDESLSRISNYVNGTDVTDQDHKGIKPLRDALGLLSVIASTLYTKDGYVWMPPVQLQADGSKNSASMPRDSSEEAKRLRALLSRSLAITKPGVMITARNMLDSESNLDLERIKGLLFPLLKDKDFGPEAFYLRYRAYMKAYKETGKKAQETSANRDLLESVKAGWPEAQVEYGEKLLASAKAQEEKNQVKKCVTTIKYILELQHCSNKVKGQAYYWLYRLKQQYPAEAGLIDYDPMELLRRSRNLGCLDAGKEWIELENKRPITPTFADVRAQEKLNWFVNDEESLAVRVFKESLKMSEVFTCAPVREFIPSSANLQNSRFLFISDDPKKNLYDALQFLQTLQTTLTKDQVPKIYLRSNAEIAASTIDTALGHLSGCCDVRIINDSQVAAQQLLTRHPLFYPLQQGDIEHNQTKNTIEFVIFGTTPVAEWLCRESFWMLGFQNKAKITIVAPEAEAFVTRIKVQNPGMIAGNIDIPGIPLAEVRAINSSYDQAEFMDVIRDIRSEKNTSLYFAVAVGSDEENLSLARWIRTGLIRNAIYEKSTAALHIQEPIAVYCADDNLNRLSRNTVVESVAYGDSWFNTWALIPFGGISDTYRWDRIENDVFERMAKCVHLEYSGINPSKMNPNLQQEINNALKDYYRRQYNRDSSYAIALSMPYRLFQFDEKAAPPYWNILERDAWFSQEAIKELIKLLPKGLRDVDPERVKPLSVLRRILSQEYYGKDLEREMEELKANRTKQEERALAVAEWEHARWIRWMLSRGWMPATPEQAVFSVKENNPRQQLFVARLHPCICAFSYLDTLASVLANECGITKEFYQYDARNVIDTEAILKVEWFQEYTVENGRSDSKG